MQLWPFEVHTDELGEQHRTDVRGEHALMSDLPVDAKQAVTLIILRAENLFVDVDNETGNLVAFENYVSAAIEEYRDELGEFFLTTEFDVNGWNFYNASKRLCARLQISIARAISNGAVSSIRLDDDGRSRVYKVIDQLRLEIGKLTVSDLRKQSMLRKLDRFSSEVAKNVSSTGYLTGLAVEVFAGAGQAGREFKPVVERIEELYEIASRGVKDVAALMKEDRKLLPNHASEESEENA